jgi:hypothetical protein
MNLTWMSRWLEARGPLLPGPGHIAICPPTLLTAPGDDTRFDVRHWFFTPGATASRNDTDDESDPTRRSGAAPLYSVRGEFVDAMRDITSDEADALTLRIRLARSLRELWHLRPDVFGLIARHHSQHEAQTRLDHLNRHFPTRSPRSGFGALGPAEGNTL